MIPLKIFATITGPCVATGLTVGLSTSPALMAVGLSIVGLITMSMAFLVSWGIEWARQDAVRMSTMTLLAELNERNIERGAMQRRIDSLRSALGVHDYSDLRESMERNLPRARGEEE